MPTVPTESGGQDWGSVNVGRSSGQRPGMVPKSARGITAAKAAGSIVTEKKYGAGGNTSAHSATIMSARKLEQSDEVGKIVKVDKSLSKAIQQARLAKKMTQKDLATAINEKPQVVGEYESGKAVPNGQIISKMERKLGCKLPRPGKKTTAPKDGPAGVGGKKTTTTRGGPAKRR